MDGETCCACKTSAAGARGYCEICFETYCEQCSQAKCVRCDRCGVLRCGQCAKFGVKYSDRRGNKWYCDPYCCARDILDPR